MKLPPPQAESADIIAYVDALEDESSNDPNRAAWDSSKQRWLDLYTGNHFADPSVSSGIAASRLEPEQLAGKGAGTICKIVYNRVMNAVLAMLAGQVGNPAKVVFSARESGEPPIYYLNGYIQHPQLQQIAMAAGAASPQVQELDALYGRQQVPMPMQQQGQPMDGGMPEMQPQMQEVMHPHTAAAAVEAGTSTPLPPELAEQVKLLIDNGKMMTAQARLAGMPPPLGIVPPDALVEITDQTTAQFTQVVFDALWEQCGGNEAATENILNKKVLGWQPTLVESDRTKIEQGESPITLTNVEGAQVFFDPMTSSFRPPRYVLMKEPVSLEEGIAKYPDLADTLKSKAASGTLNNRSGRTSGGRLFDLEYSRDMCVVRTLWIMDAPYPMEPDEAVASGKLQIGQVPVEQPTSELGGVGPGAGDTEPVDGAGEAGAMEGGPPPAPPTTRQAFIHAESGAEAQPGGPEWPVVYGIREIRDIEGELIFDRRCRLPAIPVVNNINIPVPFSPYGIGEPDRLDGLQMAINRVLSDLVTHHRYFTYPPEVCHQAVANGLSAQLRRLRIQPNTVINVPSDVAQLVGNDLSKLVQFIDVPPMPVEAWRLLEFLVEAIDKEANNSEVQQGIAPTGSSGAWVANLQAAAAQVAQVTSQATEAWLKRVVRLIVHFISNEMTEADCQRYSSKYPPAIVAAFKAKQKQLYIDIAVEVQSGSAAAKQGQTNAMIAARQGGMQVSEPSIMERMNLDPDAELKRQAEWNQKMRDTGLLDQMAEQAAAGAETKREEPRAE